MEFIIGILVAIIMGCATQQIIKGKGYTQNWFWWGFFFGLIAVIVALLKEENHYQDESQFANPAQGCFSNDEKLKKYKELLDKREISREEYEYWKQETLNTNC